MMFFPIHHRRRSPQSRQTCQAESLEPRQLLTVTQISATEVETLLDRAAVATSSEDAIIAVVDRGGQILGVRVEQSVIGKDTNGDLIPDIGIDAPANGGNGNGIIDPGSDEEKALVFAIDGAVAKARTGAFFANGTADSRIDPETGLPPATGKPTPTVGPLTSRTVRFISQTTITQREMQSNPNADPILDPTYRGPGFVAPVGIGGHFPPAIAHTPQVDLFGIEHTNRDSIVHPGEDFIKGTADDILLSSRFNAPYAAGKEITAPESYGFVSGRLLTAQSRGIATLPGGIPLYRGFDVVGGIGVFFPGTTDPDGAGPGRIGDATFEQGFVPGIGQSQSQRTNAPKVLEAEYIALAAAGGTKGGGVKAVIGALTDASGNVVPAVPFVLPFGRIDLVGITLQIIGPTPGPSGVKKVLAVGRRLGVGENTGADQQVTLNPAVTALAGAEVPEGWLVAPRDALVGGPNKLTAADVETIINQGIDAAEEVRAAIRLKVNKVTGTPTTIPGARSRMVLAVADEAGNVLGVYRMHDSTIFSIDVAVAKARNTAYYASTTIASIDQVDDNNNGVADVPTEAAFTNRTFRFLAEPRYPQGVDGSKQGDFSILNDPGFKNDLLKSRRVSINNGAVENAGAPQPYTDFQSVMGFDAFNPGSNFRDPNNIANQNGIVFFPGSAPLYKSTVLVGGFGVSGDGVDQDDVVTFFGVDGFRAPSDLRADQFFVRGVRLPYQKFNRNPFA